MTGVILEGDLREKVSLNWLTSLSWAEGEVKMYRMYREIQNLDQNFSLKLLQNFSLSESSRMTPGLMYTKIWTSQFYYLSLCLKIAGWVPNSIGIDQILYSSASDLGLLCLLRPVCLNTNG